MNLKYIVPRVIAAIIPFKKYRRKFKNKYLPIKKHNVKKHLEILRNAIIDPNGIGFLNMMLENACVPKKYAFIFYNMRENDVCVDCGANVGLITDIILRQGGVSYAFEPNPDAFYVLKRKYKKAENCTLVQAAVADKDGKGEFYKNPLSPFDVGASLYDYKNSSKESPNLAKEPYDVKLVKLTNFLDEILKKHKQIYLLKLDVEGAEFDIIEDIIKTGVYKNITHVVCETHARFFKDGKQRLKHVEDLIAKNNIFNIMLDWV